EKQCDIFSGEWIPDPDAPYYTNRTCSEIQEHQNCMKYGRPDSEYLKWRWKPEGCDLPAFDASRFLSLVAGKAMAVVGDSVGRNQMQSMVCLLSRVESPTVVIADDHFKTWRYLNYNFTLAHFWSPFLVKFDVRNSDGPTHTGLYNLYLDEPDPAWADKIDGFDYIVLSSGHWFTRTAVYYENRRIVGCRFCQIENITELPYEFAYRTAFRTSFGNIESRDRFGGLTFLRTFSPSHFEGGLWNAGGNCVRRRPYRRNETAMDGTTLNFYTAQVEEFAAATARGKKEFRLMDMTKVMVLRPDGHPSRYGHWLHENVTLYNDCVHWCLPGPIDSWADFLAHLIQKEAQ
ncbi:hypothetical protein M569_17015, partial [Genlisea aurea]